MVTNIDDKDTIVYYVQINNRSNAIYQAVFTASDPNPNNYGFDDQFVSNLNQRAEISKMMGSISSTTASFNSFTNDNIITGHIDDLSDVLIKSLGS